MHRVYAEQCSQLETRFRENRRMTAQHRRLGFATAAVAIIVVGVWTVGDSNWKFAYLVAAGLVLWGGMWFEQRARRDNPPRRSRVENLILLSPLLVAMALPLVVEWVTGSSTAFLIAFFVGAAISVVLRRTGFTKRLADHHMGGREP